MLGAVNYVPLLRTKPAEVTAFHTLSASEKAATFPIFLSKPWQNANHFQKTIDKVTGAVGSIPFGLGIDRAFLGGDAKQPAQGEFDALFNPAQGFRDYYECVGNIENAVPVFIGGGTADQIFMQLGQADNLGRGLVVRFVRGEVTAVLNLAGTIPPLPHDTVFVVDAGWHRDELQLQQWAIATVQRILNAVPNAEIVVMASSFPDSFNHILGHGEVILHEPAVFNVVRASFNESNMIYGDWATTRPPQSGGGGIIPPRIDIPMIGSCNVFRANLDVSETYASMATLAMAHNCFESVPACYGRTLIETTPSGGGVTGTQRATEARINIHIAKHASPGLTVNSEEDYVD